MRIRAGKGKVNRVTQSYENVTDRKGQIGKVNYVINRT